jgi:hypothetical protein
MSEIHIGSFSEAIFWRILSTISRISNGIDQNITVSDLLKEEYQGANTRYGVCNYKLYAD